MHRILITHLAALTLLSGVLISGGAESRTLQARRHHHYKLVDIGPFGGPASFANETAPFSNGNDGIDSSGIVTGVAGTNVATTSTSNPATCNALGYVFHAFERRSSTATDLGSLAGTGYCSYAGGVNAKGDVLGSSEIAMVDPLTGVNETRAVRWKNGKIADLGSLGGNQGTAIGINNNGELVGAALNTVPDSNSIIDLVFLGTTNGTETRAFLWRDGKMQDLGTLGGSDAAADLINDSGQIAGASYTSSNPSSNCLVPITTDPFLWSADTGMIDLGTLGGTCGFPLAMNNRGQIVGISNLTGDTVTHGFVWDNGQMTDLGTFGGSCGEANAINEAGKITGFACNSGDVANFAFLWVRGVLNNLGTLSGDTFSDGLSINAFDQVVGESGTCDCGTSRRAFLWEKGTMVDLNTLVSGGSTLQLTNAVAINDRGEITGNGTPQGCTAYEQCGNAFLLIPCDENHPDLRGCDYSLANSVVAKP